MFYELVVCGQGVFGCEDVVDEQYVGFGWQVVVYFDCGGVVFEGVVDGCCRLGQFVCFVDWDQFDFGGDGCGVGKDEVVCFDVCDYVELFGEGFDDCFCCYLEGFGVGEEWCDVVEDDFWLWVVWDVVDQGFGMDEGRRQGGFGYWIRVCWLVRG